MLRRLDWRVNPGLVCAATASLDSFITCTSDQAQLNSNGSREESELSGLHEADGLKFAPSSRRQCLFQRLTSHTGKVCRPSAELGRNTSSQRRKRAILTSGVNQGHLESDYRGRKRPEKPVW